jgi:hypothetical protein
MEMDSYADVFVGMPKVQTEDEIPYAGTDAL